MIDLQTVATNYQGFLIFYACDEQALQAYQEQNPGLSVPDNGFLWAYTREFDVSHQAIKDLELIVNDEF